MSDALPLPPRPNLDYYRTLARDLADAIAAGTTHEFVERWVTALTAQTPIGWFGEAEWPKAQVVDWIEKRMARFIEHKRKDVAPVKLTDAQFFLARIHGFASWPRFAHHIDTLAGGNALTAAYEAAADAIVNGDIDHLRALLDAHPGLVQQQSTRDHHSTLLHYTAANGVEDFRQKTPKNIVAIAELLLDRGADVNAESDAYRGHSTTLGLAATSLHPEKAGVQIPLLELLLARGANIEQRGQAGNGHGAVLGCLANGQGAAARFLASRGATLDLESAAGVDRADVVATYFNERREVVNGATTKQRDLAVLYAAGFGADDALRVLLANGASPNGGDRTGKPWVGQTPLHWTTYGPHVGAAAQLIAAGADIHARDGQWRSTPLEWALHAWANDYDSAARAHGYALVEQLVTAGARADLDRYDEKTRETLRGDPTMHELLRRSSPS